MAKPKWADKAVRSKSEQREKNLSSLLNGRKTVNSGATFGENDVKTQSLDIEHKYTDKSQFIVKMDTIVKMEEKCPIGKIPVLVIEFAQENRKFALVDLEDLMLMASTP